MPRESAVRMAIVVGVSRYSGSQALADLRYAARDASDVASALTGRGYDAKLLVDQAATRASILLEFRYGPVPKVTRK